MADNDNSTDANSGGASSGNDRQLLHFVFGGELDNLEECKFRDLSNLDLVGVFPDYKSAEKAWRGKAQQTVDNAHMRYFIVHMHKLLDPDGDGKF